MRRKLNLGFIVIILLLWAICIYTLLSSMSVHEVFVELKDDIVPGAIAMTEMDGTANQIAHGTMEYILTGDAEAKAEVQTASEWLENSLAAHKEHEINIGYLEKKEAEKLEEEGKKLISVANQILNLKDQGVSKEVLLKKDNEEFQGALHPFVEHVMSHKAEHLQELSAAETRVHGKHDANIRYTIILGLVATLLGLLIGLLVDRLFMRFITERKLAEEKLEHLNAVLLAIRNVNQLIAKEKDRDKLLKGVCENLIETRGYYNSWIALLDKSEGLVTTAEAGLGKDFLPMMELLKAGKLPDCAQKALEQSQVVLTDDPASTCTDCILAKKYSDGGAMTIRLERGGKAYGLLSASAPRGFVSDAEEQALFKEVAGDIEFALHSIELEEERKQTEEELRESEEKYRTLFEQSRDAIYINTREGKFIDANQSYLDLFGYSREEMSERNATDDYVNPDDRIRFADEIDRKGSVKDFEVKYKKKDGTEIDCLVSAIVQQSNDGIILGYQGNIRDITERKQAEETLRETEEKYRMLFENAAEAIYVAQDGKIKFPNPRTEELYGYSSEELTSKPFTYFIHEKDQNMVLERHKKRLRGEKLPTIYPFRIVNKAGDTKWVEIKVASFSWENRPATLCFLTDITERIQAEEQLKKAKQEAELANQAKSEFLANMSHEIRTPMNSVIGFTDMLLDSNLDEDQVDYASTIKSSGEVLLSLINDILDFSKIEAGELGFGEIDFDPELLAYDVCELIRPKIGPKPIEVLCHIGDNLPSNVRGDPGKFRQVLTNLMGNSSKFTDSGEIELSLDVEEESDDQIKLHATIRDTGIGLPKEKLAIIFEPFQQADGSTTRKYGGSGLGLSICKKLSELMHGDVWAESPADCQLSIVNWRLEDNSEIRNRKSLPAIASAQARRAGKIQNPGSIFHFTGWLGKAEVKQAKKFVPVSLFEKKALIVDDNQRNLDILTHVLDSVGMGIVALRNGEEVIPTLKKTMQTENPFDLCIIDIQMPGMSGYEVAKEIRSFESTIRNPWPRPGNSRYGERKGGIQKQHKQEHDSQTMSRLPIPSRSRDGEGGPKSRIPNLPLIALSSLMERDAKRCKEAGFDGFLSKPIQREKLYQMLERLLGEKKDEVEKEEGVREKIITQYSVREEMKHSVRILLAEDNPVNQKLAKMILTKAGYQVEVANNGKEAVEKFTSSPDDFDLIFMDVQMPKMDGLTATQEIRNPQSAIRNRDIPIVAMTAHAMKGDREKCLEAGMDDYITKPIKRELVFEILEKWVFNKEAL